MALSKGIASGSFYAMVNGQSGGYLESATVPSIEVEAIASTLGPDGVTKRAGGRMKWGECKVVTNISEANALWELIESVQNKNCREFEAVIGVADQNYKSTREISMLECLMKEVAFKSLDAKDGKSHMTVTATWVCTQAKFENGSGSVIKGNLSNKAKGWQCSYWDVLGFYGIPSETITKVDLCKHTAKIVEEHTGMSRWPTKQHAAWETAGHVVEGSARSYEQARDLCIKMMYDGELQESEFIDYSINIKAPNHKDIVGEILLTQVCPNKFETSGELKGNADSPLQWKMTCMAEGQRVVIKQKA